MTDTKDTKIKYNSTILFIYNLKHFPMFYFGVHTIGEFRNVSKILRAIS